MKNSALNFDPQNPEGNYVLDLGESFDQICLQNLLLAAEKAVVRSEAAFEIKQCFPGVRLNGKPKWDPPTEKYKNGLFNLGEEPSGELSFLFTLNPVALKEQEKAIKKATESGDANLLKKLKEEAAKPVESLEIDSVTKPEISELGANNFYEMLLERYEEQDDTSCMELICNLCKENAIWFSQGHESMYVCKAPNQFTMVAPYILGSVQDRHIRFAIAAQAYMDSESQMMQLVSLLK